MQTTNNWILFSKCIEQHIEFVKPFHNTASPTSQSGSLHVADLICIAYRAIDDRLHIVCILLYSLVPIHAVVCVQCMCAPVFAVYMHESVTFQTTLIQFIFRYFFSDQNFQWIFHINDFLLCSALIFFLQIIIRFKMKAQENAETFFFNITNDSNWIDIMQKYNTFSFFQDDLYFVMII